MKRCIHIICGGLTLACSLLMAAIVTLAGRMPEQFNVVEGSSLTLQGAVSVGAQRTAEGRSVSAATLAAGSSYTASLKLFGLFPVKDVAVKVVDATSVVPCGTPFGIKMFTDGVLVVGLSAVETDSGPSSPGRTCGLKAGDIITHINGQEVNTIEEVQDILGDEQGDAMTLRATRNGKPVQLSVQAIQNIQGSYQLGVWLRDSMAGIGTMTFYDPDSGVFAALGHGINDVDTATLMPMESGSIMYASVTDVKKGESGAPGELHGSFDVNRDLGDLYANTNLGIYGVLRDGALSPRGEAVEVAAREEVHVGGATILSNIAGEQVEEYQVEITHVYPAAAGDTRNLMVQVTDPRLLETTGGIVQGMSGSPILQDGKLVGAVTHVLVNDPTRGYGILAENMVSQCVWEEQAQVS